MGVSRTSDRRRNPSLVEILRLEAPVHLRARQGFFEYIVGSLLDEWDVDLFRIWKVAPSALHDFGSDCQRFDLVVIGLVQIEHRHCRSACTHFIRRVVALGRRQTVDDGCGDVEYGRFPDVNGRAESEVMDRCVPSKCVQDVGRWDQEPAAGALLDLIGHRCRPDRCLERRVGFVVARVNLSPLRLVDGRLKSCATDRRQNLHRLYRAGLHRREDQHIQSGDGFGCAWPRWGRVRACAAIAEQRLKAEVSAPSRGRLAASRIPCIGPVDPQKATQRPPLFGPVARRRAGYVGAANATALTRRRGSRSPYFKTRGHQINDTGDGGVESELGVEQSVGEPPDA